MSIGFYAIAKYIGYSLWCLYGIKLATGRIDVKKGFVLGGGRWILGLLFGIVIFFMLPATSENVYTLYFSIYVPVRILEWLIISRFLPGKLETFSISTLGWILGGVVVSFLLDFTSPEVIEDGRFCVGRCLC